MKPTAAIEVSDLSFSYNGSPILSDVNLTIGSRDCVSIVGPNAGGKTTLLKLFLGLLKPQTGKVLVFDKTPQQSRSRIGYMPQYMQYDPEFPVTVMDVVEMGCFGRRGGAKLSERDASLAALEEVGIVDKSTSRFSELSGGQRQRVLIARAIVSDPDVLMLDEPTSNLDFVVEGRFYELLSKLNERMTIIIVSHDVGFVSNFVKRVFCVNNKVVEHPAACLSGELISELYGSDMHMVRHDLEKSSTGGGSCKCS
jgi:zinc transport system ATP-binding protein